MKTFYIILLLVVALSNDNSTYGLLGGFILAANEYPGTLGLLILTLGLLALWFCFLEITVTALGDFMVYKLGLEVPGGPLLPTSERREARKAERLASLTSVTAV